MKATQLTTSLAKEGPAKLRVVLADLSLQSEVQAAAKQIIDSSEPIQLLWLNAATFSEGGKRRLTAEGIEECLAVNQISPMLLTELLLPALAKHSPGRIVVTASNAPDLLHPAWAIDLSNLQGENKWGMFGMEHYAHTKLMNIMWAVDMSRYLAETDRHPVTINCFHPGAVASDLGNVVNPCLSVVVKFLLRAFFRSPDMGAELGLHLAGAEELYGVSGKMYSDGNFGWVQNYKPRTLLGSAANPEECRALVAKLRSYLLPASRL